MHGLWASYQRVIIQSEAVGGTRRHLPRACFPYPSVRLKKAGIDHLLTISHLRLMFASKILVRVAGAEGTRFPSRSGVAVDVLNG